MNKNQVLITGFEPFGEHAVNFSAAIAERFEGKKTAHGDITATVLPVSYKRAEKELCTLLVQKDWDLVIAFGIAKNAASLRLEKLALNLNYSFHPDNDGDVRHNIPIRADGPIGYFTNVSVEDVSKNLADCKIPHELSLSAGGYVCNHVYFLMLQHLISAGSSGKGVFIHLPAAWNTRRSEDSEQVFKIVDSLVTVLMDSLQ